MKPAGLPVDLRDQRQVGNDDRLQLMRHVIELLRRERHVAPVVLPRLVVELAQPARFLRRSCFRFTGRIVGRLAIFQAEARRRRRFSARSGSANHHAKRSIAFANPAPSISSRVVRRIMRRQDHRRMLEAADQQAADVVRRVIDRAHDLGPAARAQPAGRACEKRRSRRAGSLIDSNKPKQPTLLPCSAL